MILRNFATRPLVTVWLPCRIIPPFQASPTGHINPLGLRTKWKYTAKSNVSTRISMEHSDRETAQHADRNSAARGQKLRSTRTETCPSATTRRNNSWLETSAASIWELQTSQKKLILPATVLRILQPLSSQTRSNELWHDCSSRMTTDIPDVSGQTSLTLTR